MGDELTVSLRVIRSRATTERTYFPERTQAFGCGPVDPGPFPRVARRRASSRAVAASDGGPALYDRTPDTMHEDLVKWTVRQLGGLIAGAPGTIRWHVDFVREAPARRFRSRRVAALGRRHHPGGLVLAQGGGQSHPKQKSQHPQAVPRTVCRSWRDLVSASAIARTGPCTRLAPPRSSVPPPVLFRARNTSRRTWRLIEVRSPPCEKGCLARPPDSKDPGSLWGHER